MAAWPSLAFFPYLVEGTAGASAGTPDLRLAGERARRRDLCPCPASHRHWFAPGRKTCACPLGNTARLLVATWEFWTCLAPVAQRCRRSEQLIYGAPEQQHWRAQPLVAADHRDIAISRARGGERRLAVLQRAVRVAERRPSRTPAAGGFQGRSRRRCGARRADRAEMQCGRTPRSTPHAPLPAMAARRGVDGAHAGAASFARLYRKRSCRRGGVMPPLPAVPSEVLARQLSWGMAHWCCRKVAQIRSAEE